MAGFFERLKAGLAKTRERFLKGIPWGANPEAVLEELEVALLAADVGLEATEELLEEVRASGRKDLKEAVKEKLVQMLEPDERRASLRKLGFNPQRPKAVEPKGHVVLVVGVNGVGKTTTLAKLGRYYQGLGKKVLLCAGDTFRAAGSASSPSGESAWGSP